MVVRMHTMVSRCIRWRYHRLPVRRSFRRGDEGGWRGRYDSGMENDTVVVESDVTDEALVEDELLVEEISIDGMCGVY
jgi:mycofactocin precursor